MAEGGGMMNNPELSVVVPCYNEKENILLLVNRFKEVIPKSFFVELVIVDNGSTDGSYEIINSLAKKYKFIKVVKIENNIGYGFGVWTGLKSSTGKFICWTHADMQTDLYDAIKAYELIIKDQNPINCFVKGNRKGRFLFDRFFTNCMSVFETIMLGTTLHDINAQPNLFHKNFIEKIKDPPNDFSFDLYFYYIAKINNYKIIRFPVEFKKRIHGESHWNTGLKSKWKFIKRTVLFTTGNTHIRETAYNVTSNTGKTILAGIPNCKDKITIDSFPLHFGRQIIGSHGGDTKPDTDIQRYIQLYNLGKLKLDEQISHTYELDQINEAIKKLQKGEIIGRCLIKNF